MARLSLERARAAMAEGEHIRAMQHLDRARAASLRASDAGLRSQIEGMYPQLDRAAQATLQRADRLFNAQEYTEALTLYQQLSEGLGRLPTGAAARERLARAERNPDVKLALRESRASLLLGGFANALDELWENLTAPEEEPQDPALWPVDTSLAQEAPWADDAYDPLERPSDMELFAELDIVAQTRLVDLMTSTRDQYADTPSGLEAGVILETIEADEALWTAIQTHKAESVIQGMFSRAELYFNSGMHEQARGFYQDLIDAHPDTEWAQKARDRLSEIDRSTRR